jgi:hypothetical protein
MQVTVLFDFDLTLLSIFASWDSATPDGRLVQLRALDWDTSGPLQSYPLVTVYHPNEGIIDIHSVR